MKQWIVSAASCVVVGLVFLGAGVMIGAKGAPKPIIQSTQGQRFLPQGEGKAFDTKLGQTCLSDLKLPPGASLDGASTCEELAKR
jgi:hypothetical protein